MFTTNIKDSVDFYVTKNIKSSISLKAETHNFPTTVEPFSGAATGSGGEIRDRMAGGQASFPLAGTAVYMTSYPRLVENRSREKNQIQALKKLLVKITLKELSMIEGGVAIGGIKNKEEIIRSVGKNKFSITVSMTDEVPLSAENLLKGEPIQIEGFRKIVD